MIEKVNPSHPDKIADRIAGAIVDLAYKKHKNPKIAVEVLIGHNHCYVIAETSVELGYTSVADIVRRITQDHSVELTLVEVPQDIYLAKNQETRVKCGDNGIFKGVPISNEEEELSRIVREWYKLFPYDGKFILDGNTFIACQSNKPKGSEKAPLPKLKMTADDFRVVQNPLGFWTGGINVDTGATNRKLGSDMGRAVTGGGLHGKDLSKADVSVNIACHILAQARDSEVEACCAIGDDEITFRCKKDGEKITVPYSEVVEQAREYVNELGGFEKLAEWGLL